MVIGEIISRNARRYPDKVALIFGNNKRTFKELNDRANSLLNGLLDMRVGKGDRVAILADNCLEYSEVYCAIAKGGVVIVPVNCRLNPPELLHIINNSEANTLILGQNYLEMVKSLRSQLHTVKNFIIIGDKSDGMKSYQGLVSHYPPNEPKTKVNEDDLFSLVHTSGTTGLPKGVMATHKNWLANLVNMVIEFRITHDDVALLATPFFFASGVDMLVQFYIGSTCVILQDFEPKIALETIEKEQVTITLMVPAMIASLLEYPGTEKYNLSSIRLILYGGASLPLEILKGGHKILGNVFAPIYGQMEAFRPLALPTEDLASQTPEERMKRLSSCGRELINIETRVIDENGKDVAPGEVGEIVVKGDIVMKGYWKQPKATAEAIHDGYYYTGDLATVDEKGYVYTVDRKKDVIVSGGNKIYSKEVEEIIYTCPSVAEAAVIGVPDQELGESVKAVVALKEGTKTTKEEIIDLCRHNLEAYKVPRSVDLVNKLPRNPTGKILKDTLRAKYQG